MYNAEYIKTFYNAYGEAEWGRLERSPWGRLQAIIHNDFLQRYVKPGIRVLDAGSGPGRFSISLARLGAKVTVLDISDVQLDMARKKLAEAKAAGQVERFIQGDICDLSMFGDGEFDVVVCFGGALSYVCEERQKAADELVRITKPDGVILASVMSIKGAVLNVVDTPDMAMLNEPNKEISGAPPLLPVLETGDLPGFPSKRAGIMHAAMHLYTAEELSNLFDACQILEVCGSNVTIHEGAKHAETIAASPVAWETLVELERRLNHDPGLVNSGIIMAARKVKRRNARKILLEGW